MNTIAQRAVANALHCEAKKHAYRQTQDGVVVSFVLHPQEVPESLAIAALGTRYMLALVAIGDDEQPLAALTPAATESRQPPISDAPTAGGARPKHSWDELQPSQQAGILCADEGFRKFLNDTHGAKAIDTADCATWVRQYCNVNSRSDIHPALQSGNRWRHLVSDYRAWQLAPQVGA